MGPMASQSVGAEHADRQSPLDLGQAVCVHDVGLGPPEVSRHVTVQCECDNRVHQC
jgi:hypothetical protein